MGGNLIYGSVIYQMKNFGSNNTQWLLSMKTIIGEVN
jgi:hypothetical protein